MTELFLTLKPLIILTTILFLIAIICTSLFIIGMFIITIYNEIIILIRRYNIKKEENKMKPFHNINNEK